MPCRFRRGKCSLEEVEEFAFARESYEKEPDKFFVYQKENDDYDWDTDGFYILGTYGCQWDFALVTAGERRGQVFDTDNEGACAFVASSFEEFYGQWLERLSDTERFRRELIERQELFKNRSWLNQHNKSATKRVPTLKNFPAAHKVCAGRTSSTLASNAAHLQ